MNFYITLMALDYFSYLIVHNDYNIKMVNRWDSTCNRNCNIMHSANSVWCLKIHLNSIIPNPNVIYHYIKQYSLHVSIRYSFNLWDSICIHWPHKLHIDGCLDATNKSVSLILVICTFTCWPPGGSPSHWELRSYTFMAARISINGLRLTTRTSIRIAHFKQINTYICHDISIPNWRCTSNAGSRFRRLPYMTLFHYNNIS